MDRLTRLLRLRAQVEREIAAERAAHARQQQVVRYIKDADPPADALPDVSRVPACEIRDWARRNGVAVSRAGRVSDEVREAYARACHGEPAQMFAHLGDPPRSRRSTVAVREWAARNGIALQPTGRVPNAVWAAYERAQREGADAAFADVG